MPFFRKRGNVWYFTVQVTDDNGIQKPLERPGGSTKPEAIKTCREFIQGLEILLDVLLFLNLSQLLTSWKNG